MTKFQSNKFREKMDVEVNIGGDKMSGKITRESSREMQG